MLFKQVRLKDFLIYSLFFSCCFNSFGTHIVGGEIKVKWVSGNTFEVTLTCYRDCASGNANFDNNITIGVFDQVTDEEYTEITIDKTDPTDTLDLGDECYQPPGICVEKAVYQTTATFDNNSNGYYLSWQRWSRNYTLMNILCTLSSQAGMTYYAEIPDPSKQKSTPEFGPYPRAYFCVNQLNTINFSCTDVDNDSLVYSLVTPLSATGNASSAIPPPSSRPYPDVTWINVPSTTYYNATNMVGGSPVISIDSATGILTATPDKLGLFVFAVKVEEYDRTTKQKMGEVRRDVQFKVLNNCNENITPSFVSPLANEYKIYAGDSVCFTLKMDDPNTNDSVFFSASPYLLNPFINQPKLTFSPKKGIKSIQTNVCIQTSCDNIREDPYPMRFNGNDSSCYGKNPITKDIKVYVSSIDGTLKDPIPGVFTPNGDTHNDFLIVNASINNCFDTFEIKIYDRWGDKVFESTDFLFKWDGTHYKTGRELPEGVYYYLLKGYFKDQTIERKGHISLLK